MQPQSKNFTLTNSATPGHKVKLHHTCTIITANQARLPAFTVWLQGHTDTETQSQSDTHSSQSPLPSWLAPVEARGSRHAQLQPISPMIPQVCLVSTAPLYLKQIEPSSSHSTQRLFAPTRQKNPPTPQTKVCFSREGAPGLEASGRCSPERESDRARARERLLRAISNLERGSKSYPEFPVARNLDLATHLRLPRVSTDKNSMSKL